MTRFTALFSLLLPLLPAAALADTPVHPGAQPLGHFGAWEAGYFLDQGNKVCYMATPPASTASDKPVKGRDKNVLFFITHWPASHEKNAVTVSTGYEYKAGSKAVITIA